MLTIFIRSIILYVAILISLRIMGKGEIAEMNCFDLVITLLLAEVAAIPMEDNNIPMIYGVSAVFGLTFLQTTMSYFSQKNNRFRYTVSGSPTILINNGHIEYDNLKKERITIDELLQQLRVNGYFNISDVQFAVLESDGGLSILPFSKYEDIPTKNYKHLPTSLIIDGNLIKQNLDSVNKNTEWLNNILKSHNIKNIDDVLLLVLDGYDKVFIQKK